MISFSLLETLPLSSPHPPLRGAGSLDRELDRGWTDTPGKVKVLEEGKDLGREQRRC
jgi:hypothetical protein